MSPPSDDYPVDVFAPPGTGGGEGPDASPPSEGDGGSDNCPDLPYPEELVPEFPDVVYRTIPGTPPVDIKLDVYLPTLLPGEQAPALVLVHGGGWWRGCKRLYAVTANQFADAHKFLVFNIDYRLSCTGDEPELVGSDITNLCGWKYQGPEREAAVGDVLYAIQRIKASLGDAYLPGRFNGKVAVAGGSAGGNLAFMAGAVGTGTSRADAVAGWSGPTELYTRPDGVTTVCDLSPFPTHCWDVQTYYVGCDARNGVPACIDDWNQASPRVRYGPPSEDPPAFMANADMEQIPWQEAFDLHDKMVNTLGFLDGTGARLCRVLGSSHHGQRLLYEPNYCDDRPSSETVMVTTANWLNLHVRP